MPKLGIGTFARIVNLEKGLNNLYIYSSGIFCDLHWESSNRVPQVDGIDPASTSPGS